MDQRNQPATFPPPLPPASARPRRSRRRPSLWTILTVLVPLGTLSVLIYLISGGDMQQTGATPARANAIVTIRNYAFSPAAVIIQPGQVVEWINKDAPEHTVTSASNAWTAAQLLPGQRFTWQLTRPGVYAYSCLIHPSMHGIVIVRAPSSPLAPLPTAAPQATYSSGYRQY